MTDVKTLNTENLESEVSKSISGAKEAVKYFEYLQLANEHMRAMIDHNLKQAKEELSALQEENENKFQTAN